MQLPARKFHAAFEVPQRHSRSFYLEMGVVSIAFRKQVLADCEDGCVYLPFSHLELIKD
jgi:hypothetical protein